MNMRDIMRAPISQEARAGKHLFLAGSNKQSGASMMEDCPRCDNTTNGSTRLHAKAEEYLVGLIKRDHPEWVDSDGRCPECAAYYRVLIERTGV